MVNEFRGSDGSDGSLAPVNYSSFLQQILRRLPEYPLFQLSSDRQRIIIQIDELAKALATTPGVQNPLTSTRGVRSASINFARGFQEQFPSQTRQIRALLQEQLAGAIGQEETIQQLCDRLILDNLQALPKTDRENPLTLSQDFSKQYSNQQTQEIRIESDRPGSESALKFHKLTITVHNINQFQDQLQQGIKNYIAAEVDDESEQKDLYDSLKSEIEDELSDFQELQRIVDTETFGKLKKYAKIVYLEYLLHHIQTTDQLGRIYLQDLIRRLKLIEQYINDPSKTDADYEVSYAGATINYRDVFSRAEVFDALPIIPLVAGNLGEYTDTNKGETQFICGFKLKFNGPVQTYGGQPSFDYHLSLIDPDSKEHRENLANPQKAESFAKKVLQRVLLYYFIFASRSNPRSPNYDPQSELDYSALEIFQARVLPVLQGNNEEQKKNLFRGMVRGFKDFHIQDKISRLKTLLKNGLKQQTILPSANYPIHITVKTGILNDDTESMSNGVFFDEDITNPKKCLRYISVGDAAVDSTALCQIPATITIEDIRYFTAERHEEFTWKYQIDGIKLLPVLWTPKDKQCQQAYRHQGFPNSLVLFLYDNNCLGQNKPNRPQALNEIQAFTYRFTWVLLSYICLDILLENAPNNLFIPQVRLHQGTHENPLHAEKFIANLSKGLSHLLGEKYRSNSQGFRVKALNQYKIYNGLSSLYSVLPKKFRFSQNSAMPTLDKLAIVVVSSRESDAMYSSKNRQSRMANLMGEVITVQRSPKNIIHLEPLLTFADNYSLRHLYSEPPILIDTVSNLYRQGYRHFLYIAQAPYTSTLHITKTEQDEGLYFMSPKIITALGENHADIKIYPVFFDKYYVRKVKDIKQQSLYVQETSELTSLSQDPQQQAVVFFNLFNGISVGNDKDDRFYNGVISYSTLLGKFYPGVLDDQNIRQDLIYPSPLKNDILQYLTLFHFSRFEKNKNMSIKLDPYSNLIGDDSFGSLSVFPQMTPGVEFNSLAFLTEVKKALNVPLGWLSNGGKINKYNRMGL